MELFQKLLNQVNQKYKSADKRLGGWLPGGGAPNPLSQAVSSVNPQDALGYLFSVTGTPVQKEIANKLRSTLNSSTWGENVKQLPKLMSAATTEMNRLGLPGIWSTDFPRTASKKSSRFFGTGGLPEGVRVDVTGSYGMYPFMGPHYDINNKVVSIGPKTASWIAAHELGHAIDVAKNPGRFAFVQNPELLDRAIKNAGTRALSPGAIVVGAGAFKNNKEDSSLLSAGIEGALAGIGSNQHTLRAEIQADRYGMPLAKQAGVPWNHGQNILAKGSYIASSVYPGFAQGLVGELGSRGVNTIVDLTVAAGRALQGSKLSPMEQSLAKYGYDPSKQKLVFQGNEIKIDKRGDGAQALYDFIANPNRTIVSGY
ncbi:MAG: hypothetical protein RL078_1304 [Bacteroidota bacterium]|jgi:hypothetical protein